MEAWLGKSKAKSEPTPEEIEAVAERQEVPSKEAAVETIRASVDQSGASNWPWDAETH
jgi:hypothetical protein